MKLINFKASVYKNIIKLSWPTITEQLLIMMVGVVSTIFVGRLGTAELAAVGLINMIIQFFQSVFAGLATGSTVIIARITGEGDKEKARNALMQSLLIGVLSGLAITIPGYIFASHILKVFFIGADVKVYEIGLQYYKIALIGLPFLVVDLVVAGAVRGSGDTKTPMYITFIVNIINTLLSALLIFGLSINGHSLIPAYGITGAAVAVMVARMSGGVLRVLAVYALEGRINLSLKDPLTLDFEMVKRIINVGLPAFLEQFIMQGGFLVMQVMMVSMGTAQLAAYQIGVNVNSFAFMPSFGIAVAATTLVGQSLGKRNYEEAVLYASETNKFAISVISSIGFLTFILAKPLTYLYSTDAAVLGISMHIIWIFSALDPFLGSLQVNASVLRAAGDIKYVMVTAIVGLWLSRVLTAYLLNLWFGWGVYGVMIGVAVDFCARSFMYGFRVKKGNWKNLKV